MRAASCALVLALPAAAALLAQPDVGRRYRSLVDTERRFSATSVEAGSAAAFRAYLTRDAVIFRPGPVNGWETVARQADGGETLEWAPSRAELSQAGDLGLTKTLAQEGAVKGITVNAICPGYIGTEMVRAIPEEVLKKNILPHIPVGRLGEPEEIARCVVFLASDEAGFITGSTLSANGGQYMA